MPKFSPLPRLRAFVLAAPLAVAACHVGPVYAPQKPALPPAYASTASGPAVAADWWKGFGSAELDRLIASADSGSFDIAAAVARMQQADAALRVAGGALLPQVGLPGKVSWQQGNISTPGIGGTTKSRAVDTRSYNLGPSLSFELDLWGAVADQRDAAAAAALFSRYDKETVHLSVLTSVASTWFSALAYQDRLDVSARDLHDAEDILAAITARQEAGTASLLDVTQQATLVAGIKAQQPNLRLQRDQQLAALGVLTGQLPEQIKAPVGTLEALRLPAVSPGLPSTLLARRPDVAAAEASLMQQNANIRAARAAFFPTISLTGSAGLQSAALNSLLGPGSVLLNAAASASQTIFDNGTLSAQLAQARARNAELLADYRKSVVQAFTDVEDGLTQLRETTEQVRLQQQAVDSAQAAANIARAQVRAGTLDIVTALQTQTTLFNDLDALTQARLARVQALVTLSKALGGGWTQSDVIPPDTPSYNGLL